MEANKHRNPSPFVKLDDQVSLASASERVVKTQQEGRVLGFGCNGREQEALESLKNFAKQARENPSLAGADFEQKLRAQVQQLEQAIATSQRERAKK